MIWFGCRYLLKFDPMALQVHEVDAILSMVTSPVLFQVQTMQDMQVCLYVMMGYLVIVICVGFWKSN